MKTSAIISIVIAVLAIAAGIWLAAPLFYDKAVNEALPSGNPSTPTNNATTKTTTPTTTASNNKTTTLATGTFTDADDFHKGSGTTNLIQVNDQQYLRFEDNFSTTNGPDLYVYFGKNGKYDPNAQLGRLKGNVGAQNYEIPADIDPSDYNEVWIWCRAFSVPFASATLQ